jgi:nitroreductase
VTVHLAESSGRLSCWRYHKVKSQTFNQNLENVCQAIVEGSAPSEMKYETPHRVRAIDIGALATLGNFAPIDGKSIMMVINLDLLAPYEGTAQDKQH